jgi:hypothetical protein
MVHTIATVRLTAWGRIFEGNTLEHEQSQYQESNGTEKNVGKKTFEIGATRMNSFFSASLQKDARRKVQ